MFEIEELTKKSELIIEATKALRTLQDANAKLDGSIMQAEVSLRRMEQQLGFIEENEFRFYKKE